MMRFFKNSLFYVFLYLLPKNAVSSFMGRLVSMRVPKTLALAVNKIFATVFKINVDEAEKPLADYENLQQFFIRRLKKGSRNVFLKNHVVISPCDGTLSVASSIDKGTLIQAKGRDYSVKELVADDKLASIFNDGQYATLYLSPRDYHRFHMPITGVITKTTYIRGCLWPVNTWAVSNIKNLFCVNERVITEIVEPISKKRLLHIAVGATMVGKIELEYCDISNIKSQNFNGSQMVAHDEIELEAGQELGKFMFGSTIVMLIENGLIDGFLKDVPSHVKMGEVLGNFAKVSTF